MTDIIQCPNCLGEGQIYDGHDQKQCPDCNGAGKIEVWIDEDLPPDEVDKLDLLLDDPDFVPFDENQHTPKE